MVTMKSANSNQELDSQQQEILKTEGNVLVSSTSSSSSSSTSPTSTSSFTSSTHDNSPPAPSPLASSPPAPLSNVTSPIVSPTLSSELSSSTDSALVTPTQVSSPSQVSSPPPVASPPSISPLSMSTGSLSAPSAPTSPPSSSPSPSILSSSSSSSLLSPLNLNDTSSDPPKPSKQPTKCPLEKCLLCTREQPHCLLRSPTWPAIMRVVFYTLKHNYAEKEFFNLKEDVYSVMLFHWNKLSIHKKSSSNWKKHIQDMLSHSKEMFESGLEIYGQNGYWRLKVTTDPWTLSGKTRRSPKKGLALKRPLEDSNPAEQMMRRPFIPYIAKGSNQQPMSYVFINEHSSPPRPPAPAGTVLNELEATPVNHVNVNVSPSYPIPNPFGQRYTFVPAFASQQSSPPSHAPVFTSQQALSRSPPQQAQSSQSSYRHAISLPSSRRQSPQRSRSPSPQPQSLPTSPRTVPPIPSIRPYTPYSAPVSPTSHRRGSQPLSPRSQPISPPSSYIPTSPPPSPHSIRALRALRSPPSPQSPQTPLSPRSPPPSSENDSALDTLRNTFEHFQWTREAQANNAQEGNAGATGDATSPAPQYELHHLAFNLFASAKPANPCDVAFLLNE